MKSEQKGIITLLCILAIIIVVIHEVSDMYELYEKIRDREYNQAEKWFNDVSVGQQKLLDAYNKLMAEYDATREADLARLGDPSKAATWVHEQEIPNTFSKEIAKTNAHARIDEWHQWADMENENAERMYSLDMKYAAYISTHPNPIFQNEVITGETEGCSIYRNGIGLTDRQSGTSRQLVVPEQGPIRENISNLVWNLESDVIYFTSYGDTVGSAGVYGCNIFSGEVSLLSDGNLVELILDEPYVGWLKILNSCFIEGEGGCHWYYAALSPDGETEIRLSEPSLDIPEN